MKQIKLVGYRWAFAIFVSLILAAAAATARAQTTTFTYQGRLTDNNFPANTTYEMQFKLFDTSSGGLQLPQPTPITITFTVAGSNAVSIVNGAFTVPLDFGSGVFTGADRWLEISVRKPSDPPGFTLLTPRQQITSSPYSLRASGAAIADIATNALSSADSAKLNGQPGSAYVLTTDSRLSDARNPLAGSANYIQNTTNPQTGNFNISGNGTVGGIFTGNGSGLTNLNGANLTAASVTTDKLAPVFGYFYMRNVDVPFTIPPGGSVPFAVTGPPDSPKPRLTERHERLHRPDGSATSLGLC